MICLPSPEKISTPANPTFTLLKWGVRGSKSHECAIMMQSYTKFLVLFFGVVVVFVCVCARARQKQELAIEKKKIGLRARL